jgi:FixJ family two-component response regulator
LITALVADDEALHRELLCVFLETMGFSKVFQVRDPSLVVPTYVSIEPRPAVVLLDHPMGRFSGMELLRDILAEDERARVIMMSQDGDARKPSLQSGALDFIEKPYSIPEVGRAINRAMRPGVGS